MLGGTALGASAMVSRRYGFNADYQKQFSQPYSLQRRKNSLMNMHLFVEDKSKTLFVAPNTLHWHHLYFTDWPARWKKRDTACDKARTTPQSKPRPGTHSKRSCCSLEVLLWF